MAKGGARNRSGPAPDPDALRREKDAGDWFDLPAEGRVGPPPEWPLSEPYERELDLWARLWMKPQALMWERFGQEFEVALYVRRFVEAEEHESRVNLSTLVRQMADSLGLTTPGMRANRWRIARREEEKTAPKPTIRSSARERFGVVNGGAA